MTRLPALATTLLIGMTIQSSAQTATTNPAKSTSGAIKYSMVGTLIPAGLGAYLVIRGAEGMGANEGQVALGIGIGSLGLILGPSLGHAYAQRPKPMKGSWTRLAGVAIAGLGLASMGMADAWGDDESSSVYVLMAAGSALYLYGVAKDMSKLDESVASYNHRHGFTAVRLAPAYFVQSDAVGLAVSIGL